MVGYKFVVEEDGEFEFTPALVSKDEQLHW